MMTMTPILDTAYVRFELDGNLLIATYKKGKTITLEIAKKIVQDRIDFTEHQPVLVLLVNQGGLSFNKEARDYLASAEATEGIKAAVILSDTAATAMIGNFIIKVNKPHIPVRMFTNRAHAISWLNSKG